MMSKLLIILSITLNTLGLSSQATNIDRNLVGNESNSGSTALASELNFTLPEIMPYPTKMVNSLDPTIYANNFILMDRESGVVLAGQDIHQKVPIASTTKIMTATIVLENYDLDEIVTISEKAANEIGATANFRVGEQITVLNMLKCMLIKSANGAADALAEHMNGPGDTGFDKFLAKMNEKAKELGMNDTEYRDPAGLDVTGYSSAYDLATITNYALKNPTFAEIVKTDKATVTNVNGDIWHSLENSNRLVNQWDYPGAIGVKTGYMPEAGHCLVGAATREGHTLIAVILHTYADTATASADEARRLLDWGFNNIFWE